VIVAAEVAVVFGFDENRFMGFIDDRVCNIRKDSKV
jgi:hypothetical protein